MRLLRLGVLLLPILLLAAFASGATAQSPGWQTVSSQYGWSMQLPASYTAVTDPPSGVAYFSGGITDQSISVAELGPLDQPGISQSVVDTVGDLLWPGFLSSLLGPPLDVTAFEIVSPLAATGVSGARHASTGAVSYSSRRGVSVISYRITAMVNDAAYELDVIMPTDLDSAQPDIAKTILSSFRLIAPGAVATWPQASSFRSLGSNSSAACSSCAASFSDGTYIVGTDIASGTYRAPGGTPCYWERESGFGGTTAEIIANDVGHVSPIVTILPSDAGFKTSNCGTWSRV